MTSSAVLFLVFNRPEQASQVFAAIRKARPRRLYIAADGPRPDRSSDAERCSAVRAICEGVDWPCEVQRLYRSRNLGCKHAVSQAIDWFFATEKEGIILEDDCLPAESFFLYCDELLERYRDDERVMSICGSNTLPPLPDGPSYFFSRHCRVWGWATWRRAWRHYDLAMKEWPEFRAGRQLRVWSAGEIDYERYWTSVFDRTYAGEIGTWDYQWMFACLANGGLACRPNYNMISNLGFGEHGTHTLDADSPQAAALIYEVRFPLLHPANVLRNASVDQLTQRVQFSSQIKSWHIAQRALRKIDRIREVRMRKKLNLDTSA